LASAEVKRDRADDVSEQAAKRIVALRDQRRFIAENDFGRCFERLQPSGLSTFSQG
jgi:hypothetical protein